MKVRKKLQIQSDDVSETADELGRSYEVLSERAKAANNEKAGITSRIKALAREVGEADGDCTLIKGETFEVGYQAISGRHDVDWPALAKAAPKLYARLASLQPDPAKVDAALANGTLPRRLLKKYMTQISEPTTRIVVRRQREHNEDAE